MIDDEDPDEVLAEIKTRARDNAFSYTRHAFDRMVDGGLYEEDVKRAFSTASLDGLSEDDQRRPVYILSGFGMDEETLLLTCRMSKHKVMVLDVDRAGDP